MALQFVPPGLICEKGCLRGQITESRGVEIVEVLKFIGTDLGFCPLCRLFAVRAGDEFRADFRFKYIQQDSGDLAVENVLTGNPADDVLNKCFGNAHIDIVMGHVVPDPVSAPS